MSRALRRRHPCYAPLIPVSQSARTSKLVAVAVGCSQMGVIALSQIDKGAHKLTIEEGVGSPTATCTEIDLNRAKGSRSTAMDPEEQGSTTYSFTDDVVSIFDHPGHRKGAFRRRARVTFASGAPDLN